MNALQCLQWLQGWAAIECQLLSPIQNSTIYYTLENYSPYFPNILYYAQCLDIFTKRGASRSFLS
jgi:hypothetical protein